MDEVRSKIQKLEDSAAFTDRTCEQLSEELQHAFARIASLEKRLGMLDDRVLRLTESLEQEERTLEDDVPPHSGKR